jgi:glutathione transport system substrate-binding protein
MVSPTADAAGTIGSKAVGTGPYKLQEYKSGEYVLETKNTDWWGGAPKGADEIKWTWTAEPSVMNMALQTGDADIVNPLPAAFAKQLAANPDMKVNKSDGSAVFWVSLNTKLKPLDDARVRQALNYATDRDGLVKAIMQGNATPANSPLAPVTPGYDKTLAPYTYDVDKAKKLLADAGYPNGFEVTMNCPNDRYVNDSAICQAVAANLARIGVKINLQAETKVSYFPKILRRDTSFYLLGWTPSTVDAHDVLSSIMATPNDKGQGTFNLGAYSNPKLDELTQKIQSETDQKKRNDMIREAFKIHQDDVGHIPLHQQALAWAHSDKVSLVQLPNNYMYFKWITLKSK